MGVVSPLGHSQFLTAAHRILRLYRREKALVAFIVLTIGPGIGATAAMFSIVNGVLLRPLGYPSAERLYVVREVVTELSHLYPTLPVNARHFEAWRNGCRNCQEIALIQPTSLTLTGSGEPRRLDAVSVTPELFPILGIVPPLGRPFMERDSAVGEDHVVLIGDRLWKRAFESDPKVVGRVISLDGHPHEIVGVLPPEFRFPKGQQLGMQVQLPSRIDAIKPLAIRFQDVRPMGNFNYACIVKLRQGASLEQATSEMNAAIAPFGTQFGFQMKAALIPLKEQVIGPVRTALWLLLAAVGGLLVIVCVNLANLMQLRASRQAKDAAIRRALGANQRELFGLALREAIALTLPGGAAGVLFTYAGLRLLLLFAPPLLPRVDELEIDLLAAFFAILASMGSALLVGLWPALRLARRDPQDLLRQASTRTTQAGGRFRPGAALVGFEVALSSLLLILSGYLMVSLIRILDVEKGFQTRSILALELSLPMKRYPEQSQRSQFHRRLLEELQSLAGVASVGLVNLLPLQGEGFAESINIPQDSRRDEEQPIANYRFVNPDYWETMGIELLQGRTFRETDRDRPVAVLARHAARAAWPDDDPIGKRFQMGAGEWMEVVGIVEDVRTVNLETEPVLMVYVPYWQTGPADTSYAIRTISDPLDLAQEVRKAVWRVDSQLPVRQLTTMDQILAESLAQRRFITALASVFAASALMLACLGIYSVVSYAVARRTNEIGVRMALGADGRSVLAMILVQGMKPVVAGLAVGLLGALSLGRLLESLLFEVSTNDPWILGIIVASSAAMAALACLIPAQRALSVEPKAALQYE